MIYNCNYTSILNIVDSATEEKVGSFNEILNYGLCSRQVKFGGSMRGQDQCGLGRETRAYSSR